MFLRAVGLAASPVNDLWSWTPQQDSICHWAGYQAGASSEQLGPSQLCWVTSVPKSCQLEPPALTVLALWARSCEAVLQTSSSQCCWYLGGQESSLSWSCVSGPVQGGVVSRSSGAVDAVKALEMIPPGGASSGLQRKPDQKLGLLLWEMIFQILVWSKSDLT